MLKEWKWIQSKMNSRLFGRNESERKENFIYLVVNDINTYIYSHSKNTYIIYPRTIASKKKKYLWFFRYK